MKSDLFYKGSRDKASIEEREIHFHGNNEVANFCHLLRYAPLLMASMTLVILTLETKKYQ